ncbi:hypothetical protein BDB01DRAFT_722013 [Pilobolus umbonatus]|nr:hypothetical protein BDB01DRAFT_722013 [Pilobolus umbonatus]
MSIDINWSKLDDTLAGHVQQFLNKHFQNISKPSFIGDIEVTGFQWGTETPQIEITDITEPFPAFYEEEESDVNGAEDIISSTSKKSSNDNDVSISQSSSMQASEFFSDDGSTISAAQNTTRLSFNPPFSQQQRFNMMHSFHRSPFVAPQHPFTNNNNNGLYFASPPIPPLLNTSHWTSNPPSLHEEDWIDDEEINRMVDSPVPSVSPSIVMDKKLTEMDFQIHMLISYKGDMSMTMLTELRMNYPSIKFLSLPIQLRVQSVEFEAIAVVAYIQSMNRICISMLEPEDDPSASKRGRKDGLER